MDLNGKIVVVTGAGRGQGATEATLLTDLGAQVVAVDMVFEEDIRATARLELDVTSRHDWARLADLVRADFGAVHGLVNNAAIPGRSRVLDVDDEEWDRVMGVNVKGSLLGMQTLVPFMGPGASIVNISSLAGLFGVPSVAYGTSKWALRGLTQSAAHDFGPRGIRVNTVLPGYVDTPLVRQNDPVMQELTLRLIPLGRTGETSDIAPIVAFLLSDHSAWISGAEIPVDGGQHVHGGMKLTYETMLARAESGG